MIPAAVFHYFQCISLLSFFNTYRTLHDLRSFGAYADLRKQTWSRWYVALLFAGVFITCPPEAAAVCVAEVPKGGIEVGLVMHLSAGCTPAEREAHAVRGEDVMETIAEGRPVDLAGVVVRGDILFDRLAAQTPVAETRRDEDHANESEQRLVRAALIIRDSEVLGTVGHRSAGGTLRFEGPVMFFGTHFKEGVDLSRSVFLEPVELSGVIFEKEAYFVQGQFLQQVGCHATKFGPNTRFHRSVFRDAVNCTEALFDGMTEFIEVTFEQPVTFERSRFGLGTGFSGSRFKGPVSFRDAIFSRETFFGFAAFESDAVFAGARFLGPADFSNAEFRQADDLAKASFDQPPLFSQTTRLEQVQPAGFLHSRNGQYVLTMVFLILAALLVAYVVKLK